MKTTITKSKKRTRNILRMLVCALFLLGLTSAQAQTITIGAGALNISCANGAATDPGPIYRSSAASAFDFSRHHILYTAAELSAMPSGSLITNVGFNMNGGATVANAIKFNIYMKNSALTTSLAPPQTFASLTAASTLVYSSTSQAIPATVGYLTFAVTPFIYTGGALELSFDWDISNVTGNPTTGAFIWKADNITGRVLGTENTVSDASLANARTVRVQTRFTYTGASPCTGTPAPGNTISSANPVCNASSFTLSLQNNTSGTGVTYQWQSSPTGTTYTNIAGATSPTYTGTQSSATYYLCVVTCSSGPSSGTSTPLLIAMQSGTACLVYCVPSQPSGCSIDYVSNVTLSTINRTSVCDGGTTTNLFTTPNPTVIQGSTYPISVSTGGDTEGAGVWIDWNQNGVFDIATEQILSSYAGTNPATYTATVTVPITAVLGTTLMRVRCNYAGTSSPCTAQTYGECEDYYITVAAAIGCTGTPASSTTLSSLSTVCSGASFTLSLGTTYTASGLTFQWQSSPNGTTWTNIAGATSNTYNATQTAATYYYCQVTCTNSGLSILSSSLLVGMNTSPCSCLTYAASAATSTADDEILNVTFGTLNNTSVCGVVAPGAGSAAYMYSNYTGAVAAPTVLLANTVSGSVTIGFCNGTAFTTSFAVYADWNQNGVFTDAGELVYSAVGLTAAVAGTAFPFTITVPGTATLGITRLRVVDVEGSAIPSSTGSYTWGETEDYCINVNAPAGCAGTPAASTTVSSLSTVCSGVNFTLSLGTVYALSGITYQWQSSPTGTTYTNIAGATGSSRVGSQTAATYYQCIVTCTNSSLSITSTSILVGMNTSPCNCLTYATSNATNTADDEIFNVTVGSLNNTSACGAVAGAGSIAFEYSNYTGIVTAPSIFQGILANGSVTIGFCGGSAFTTSFAVYIDYNQNGVFTDAGEMVYNGSGLTAAVGGTAFPFTFTVPIGATLGTTRMRVVDVEGTLTPASTGTYTWGETEDYCVTIAPATACSGTPTAGSASSSASTICGTSTTTLSLSGVPAVTGLTYQWQQSINGAAYTNIAGATSSSYTTGALSTSGNYTFLCVVTCSNSGLSANSTATSVIIVYASASISPSTIGLCAGASATATASPAGATSYQWSGGSTATTPSITVTTAGTYTCTVTQGTCVTSATASASVSALPVFGSATATPSAVCFGANSQLNAAATGPAAPANTYSFASSTGTIVNINGTGTLVGSGAQDDNNYAVVTIPFSFNYAGGAFTTAGISDNGFLKLGGVTTTSYVPLPALTNCISALGADMYGNDAAHRLEYQTTGSAPNRVFRVQWSNWGKFSSGLNEATFQIALFETSGVIQIGYIAAPGTTAFTAQAGLTGAAVSDFNVRTTTTNWAATTAAGANSAAMTFSGTVKPASGTIYTFTPPPVTYAWSPATFLSATNISNPLASAVTASTTYTVTATTYAGCSSTATVPVTVNTLPVGSASGTGVTGTGPYAKTICSGASTGITLNASIASTFTWTATSTGTIGFTASGSGATINDALTGAGTVTYIVTTTATGTLCVGAAFTVVVTVNPLPVGVATPASSTFCSGGTTSIALTGGSTYTWTVTGASGSSPCPMGCGTTIAQTLISAIHNANVTVNYSVTPISAAGCVGTVFHAIETVRPTPTFTGGPAYAFLCSGSNNNINLSSSVLSTYTWTSTASAGVSGNADCSSSCTSPISQTLTNTGSSTGYVAYTITPTSSFGCIGTPATVEDSVGLIPSATVTGPTTLCSGDIYSPTMTTITPGAVFTWASSVTAGSASGNSTCGGSCGTLSDNLVNTGTTTATVHYVISISTATCSGADENIDVTLNSLTAITCPGNISVNNDAGVCGATVSFSATVTGTSTSVSYSQDPGTLFPIETTTVMVTATGSCGTTQTCSFDVTVTDAEAPVITCPATMNFSTDAGLCTSSASIGMATATDNCSGVTVSGPVPAGPYGLGATTVTWTATDANGNTAECTQTINVADNEAPVITVPAMDMTVECDGSGNTAAFYDWLITNWGDADATDNCTDAGHLDNYWVNDYSSSNWVTDCGSAQHVYVGFAVYDGAGNYSSWTYATFTIEDTQAPVITSTPSAITISTDAGLCTSSSPIGEATANDDCSGTVTPMASPAGPYSVGTTTVTWTATDACGNSSTSSQMVTVTDSEAPMISCPATANINTDAGSCNASSAGTATATDNCTGATVSVDNAGPYSVGTTTLIWTATDASGNTASCSQTINVMDSEAPMISCPAMAMLNTDAGSCMSSSSAATATATDNCSVASVTVDNSGPYSVGTTTVTWTATDVNGNMSTCSQDIMVMDSEAPMITCPANANLSADAGSCTSSASIGTASATDNCIIASVVVDNAGPYSTGTTTVTWTATDVNGNMATCSQDVIVTDTEAPMITCPATANINTDAGSCTASSAGMATATDNCTGATVGVDNAGPYSVGTTTVIWTATDASGNTSSCSQTINVTDSEAPMISCPAMAMLNTDAGSCMASSSAGTATATDNCSVASVTVDNSGPYSVGTTTVTWTATDVNGNMATCTQDIMVMDSEAPMITCPATANLATDAGSCMSSSSAGMATATDNCTVASVTVDNAGPYSTGTTTVTWTATDVNGNMSTCSQDVIVTDSEAPMITCPATTNLSTDAGSCMASSSAGMATATDNCTGATVSVDNAGPYSVGTTTVIWTATDASGNTSSCSQTINVMDSEAPMITCPATANLNTDAGSCTSSSSAGTASAVDNCAIATVVVDNAGPYSVGTTTLTWTATDVNGNMATCSQVVMVTDSEAPTVSAPADIVVCSGTVFAVGTATGTDNCGTPTITSDAPGTFPIGTTVITWTATDASGNTATASQSVTINPAPTGTSSSIVICDGTSVNQTLSASMPGSTFSWTAANTSGLVTGYNDCAGGCSAITDILTNLSGSGGVVVYTVTPSSSTGCAGVPFTVTVTVATIPAPPVLTGPFAACGLATVTYTAASAYATSYTWTVPTGITITSGVGTSAITCTTTGFTNPGYLTCTTSNNCGSSTTTTVLITKKPAAPLAIIGPASVCGLTTAIYSIAPCLGATSYSWTLPAGMTITAGTGTTQITVSINPALVLGNMRVDAVNACGYVAGPLLLIVGHAPATPGTLTGPTSVCGMTTATYSIPGVAYATGYTWTVPSWMTITGGSGTTSITVMATGAPAAGTVSVAGTNVCGTGTARSVTLSIAAALPGAITGPASICGMTTAAYSVASLGAGYTYNWTLSMASWTITSGAGSTMIIITGPATSVSASGLVKVTATNSCGSTSGIRTKAVTYCHSAIANNNNTADANSNTFTTIYPNPTSGEFKIDVTTDINEEMTVQVYDVLGNLFISEKHQVASGTTTLNTNIENYKNGMYFVRLVDSNSSTVYSQTVIKQ